MSELASTPDPLAHRMRAATNIRRLARRAATVCLWAALGSAVGLTLAVGLPPLVGYQTLTVLSGSMEPTIRTGDVVVDARIRPLEARIGDVVTFADPENRTRLITHRVRRVQRAANSVRFETKGDANNTAETWSVPVSGTIGRVEYRVPKLGYAIARINSRSGRLLLVVVPALLLGLYELKRVWFPKRPEAGRGASA